MKKTHSSLKRSIMINLLVLLLLTLFFIIGCGGGDKNKTISGNAQKGAFSKDSPIIAYALDKNGLATKSKEFVIKDNKGSFTLALGTNWTNCTRLEVSGTYYDEFINSNRNTSLTLKAIIDSSQTNSTGIKSNINLFTHFAAARTMYLVKTGFTVENALTQAEIDLKNEFEYHAQTGSIENDTPSWLLNLTKQGKPNAILLLFSGSFLAANSNATTLLKLTDDFADNGKIDGLAKNEFQAISNAAGAQGMLEKLVTNLKKAGYKTPPDNLNTLPLWVNINPIADIENGNLSVKEGSKIIELNGGKSKDPDGKIIHYKWEGKGVSSCNNSTICHLDIPNLKPSQYIIALTVTDNQGASTKTSIKLTVTATGKSQPPVAKAGADQTLTKGSKVTLDGSKSTDPEGKALTYKWQEGTTVKGTKAILVLDKLTVGEHIFMLTVTDDEKLTDTDDVKITVKETTVNQPPVAKAGADQTATKGSKVTLNGSQSTDPEGKALSYTWKEETTLKGTKAILVLDKLSVGEHVFELTVTDDEKLTDIDSVKITVTETTANQPPTAKAGADQIVKEGEKITLNGSQSTDPEGKTLTYEWKKGTIVKGTQAVLVLDKLSVGEHLFGLTVTDNGKLTNTDNVKVTVTKKTVNQPPVAKAGADQTVKEEDKIILDGSQSTDPEGKTLTYKWNEGTTLKGTKAILLLDKLSVGEHIFKLTVTNDGQLTDTDEVKIIVTSNIKQQIVRFLDCKNVAISKEITCTVEYNTSDGNTQTKGLAFQIFFDNSKLEWVTISDILKYGKIAASKTPVQDTKNEDNDSKTNFKAIFGWADTGHEWPDVTPQNLFTITFKAISTNTISTTINFLETTTNDGYQFQGKPHVINITK